MQTKSISALSIIPLIVACSLLPLPARGDSWEPFHNSRQVDPTGRYYLVLKKAIEDEDDPGRGTTVDFQLAERKPGSASVEVVADQESGVDETDGPRHNPEVKVREGDTLLGRGRLERCPRRILISSKGLGFVGIGVRGYNYGSLHSGDAIVIVNPSGTVLHRKALVDLFTEKEVENMQWTAGGVEWFSGGWIDEIRREVILVSGRRNLEERFTKPHVRIVSFKTGKVRAGTQQEIIRALEESLPEGLEEVLDIVNDFRPQMSGRNLGVVAKPLAAILDNPALSLASRLRAAVALGSLGDMRGTSLIKDAALVPGENQEYAIYQLRDVLGEEAVPVFCEVVRRFGCEFCDDSRDLTPVGNVISNVSHKSKVIVPQLIKLLEERGKFAYDCQAIAAKKLEIMSEDSDITATLPALMKVLEDKVRTKEEQKSNHQWAAIVLGEIGSDAKAALPLLIERAKQSNKKEWERVKDGNPDYIMAPGSPQNWSFSEDCFVNAICRIRRE